MGVEVVPEIELAVVPGGAEMEVENPLSEALLRIAEVEGFATPPCQTVSLLYSVTMVLAPWI